MLYWTSTTFYNLFNSPLLCYVVVSPLWITLLHTLPTGNLGLTLRHRLQCEIKTEHEVRMSITNECPISPTEGNDRKLRVPFQKFTAKVELTTEKPRAKMLVSDHVFPHLFDYNTVKKVSYSTNN